MEMVKNRPHSRSKLKHPASLGLFALAILAVVFVSYQSWASVPRGEGFVAISEGDQTRTGEFFDSARLELHQILNQNSYYETAQDNRQTTFQNPDDESITIRVAKDRLRPKHLKAHINCSVKPPFAKTFQVRQQECKRMQKVIREWWEKKKATDDALNPVGDP